MAILLSFLSGLVFAIGLGISGMTNPNKVTGFLNLVGDWDPSLMLVLAGATCTYFIGHLLIVKRQKPILDETFHLPTRRDIDKRLVLGGALFGLGWGLVGFCPGPALVALVSGHSSVLIFVVSMGIGMVVFDSMGKRQTAAPTPQTGASE